MLILKNVMLDEIGGLNIPTGGDAEEDEGAVSTISPSILSPNLITVSALLPPRRLGLVEVAMRGY